MDHCNKNDILEKGAIVQKDRQSYAIAPHLPAGLISADQLRKIADISDKYNAAALKISSSQRLVIVGVKEEDLDNIWNDLEMSPGAAIGLCVRSIRTCPGTSFCKRAQQDSLSLGLKLDQIYHGLQLPSKLKIGVSGCPNSCSESAVRDIGFIGTTSGFKLYVGGCASGSPRIGDLIESNLSIEEALNYTEKIIDFIKRFNSKKRLGKIIDEISIEKFKSEIEI